MQIEPFDLPGLALITPARFGDARGWFTESWNGARMAQAGISLSFVQDNHSMSAEAGTLRGLHYQAPPFAQTKLVRCTHGAIWDVAVDVRRGSPSYGHWRGVRLDAETGAQLLAPAGFLHGFLTLTPYAQVQYKVDAGYDAACDGGVAWDDPTLAIDWPLAEAGVAAPILSAKDAAQPALAAWTSPFDFSREDRT
jgi:dTDP-4-dehydrorhamnose 3,5-epimerase